jgi:hypothetical protein
LYLIFKHHKRAVAAPFIIPSRQRRLNYQSEFFNRRIQSPLTNLVAREKA